MGIAVLTAKCGRGQYARSVARNRRGRLHPQRRAGIRPSEQWFGL